MTDFPTLGEQWAQRELQKEKREGVDHYVVGQHRVEYVAPDDPEEASEVDLAILQYVTPVGLVVVIVGRENQESKWEPIRRHCRVIGLSVDYGLKPLPEDWTLSENSLRLLNEAAAAYRA